MAERRIAVAGERPYDVVLGHGVSAQLAGLVGEDQRVAVIHPHPLSRRAQRLLPGRPGVQLIAVPDGEAAKTPEVLAGCWHGLAQSGLTRDDYVVGFGGGATTDLAGFAAATYLRGVAYIALPTTVLAMADAAVGGKTGVDLTEGKNLVGAFYEPKAVLADLDWLEGLDKREVIAGLAEIVKCGLIADGQITEQVAGQTQALLDPASEVFADCLGRAIEVKAGVVAKDFREATSTGALVGREALNYGHTLAHAIETLSDHRWRHGEAVSVGMVYAAEVARRLGLLSQVEVDLHRHLLAALGLPTAYSGATFDKVRAAMALDKKARGQVLRFVLLNGLTRPVIRAGIEERTLLAAYDALGTA
jgi:3-dehydroquinate synthase